MAKTVVEKPKVVILGGGTGMPVLLRGLKDYPLDLSVIVAVSDDGGSTGRLREEIEIPAPGDVRNVVAALANVDEELLDLLQHRFMTNGMLDGHSLGNIILTAMYNQTQDFYLAVKQLSKLLQVSGKVLPISKQALTLHAIMQDGTIVDGESNIPKKHEKIDKVYITPDKIEPNPEAIQSIREADFIVISPGSLYTSILPSLVFPEIKQALRETKAYVMYVCNAMTQYGETDGYSAKDHVEAIHDHLGEKLINQVLLHNKPIDEEILKKYHLENAMAVKYDVAHLKEIPVQVIEEDIIDYSEENVRHDTEKIASIINKMAYQMVGK